VTVTDTGPTHPAPPDSPLPFAAPRSRLELAVASIWQQLLDIDRVGIDDDFFRLGGDSLLAVRMLAAVEEVVLTQVSFSDFVEAPTLASLCEQIGREREQGRERPTAEAGELRTAADASSEARSADRASPLSFAQERLWFVEQMEGATGAYNLPIGVRLRGDLDTQALETSLGEIVRRHDALRTTFALKDGAPVQIVSEDPVLPLERIDLLGCPDPETEARRLVDELVARPFDLERGPLFRIQLVRLADEDYVLELVFHHIVCDGWSHVVFFRELEILYGAYVRGEKPVLAEPGVRYADFARAQCERVGGTALDDQVAHWRERLTDFPRALELPTSRPRPPVPSHRGATRRSRVPSDTAEGVHGFSREAGVTPFATLLACFEVLLFRSSGQEKFLVGATAAGRDAKNETAIGLFANTIVLRADLSSEPTFEEVARRAREVVLDAVAHQEAPFQRIVAELQPAPDLSRHPLFQVFFAHVPQAALDLGEAVPWDASLATSRFDLTVWVEEKAGKQLELVWEYSTDLFDADTIERLERQFLILLDAGIADPHRAIADLPLLDEEEARRALAQGARDGVEYPVASLAELFQARAASTPDAVAVICEGAALTYRELNERANRLAHRLRALEVGPEVLVALFLERSVEQIVAILGVVKAGGAYVPLDPEYPSERLSFLLEDSSAPVLVTEERLLERLPSHRATIVCLDRDAAEIEAETTADPEPSATPENLAYIIYTSGSTGRPKGVQVEHRHVARLFSATDAWYRFGPSDAWMLLHSYAFDFSVWEVWGALLYGGRLVVVPRWTARSPDRLAELVARERVTVLNATPSLFLSVMDALLGVADTVALRFVIFGGEALRPPELRSWFERFGDDGPTLVNMYGITETTVHVTYQPLSAAHVGAEASVIGRQIPDLDVHVLDERLEPLPDGVPGELYVGGAGVTRGYLNRPELTAERFLDNPFGTGRLYRTGDRARRLKDGGLEYLGRIDDQVKIRGFRIELGEVQAVLAEHPAVVETAVIALEAAPGDVRLAAYAVTEPGATGAGRGERELRDDLWAHLRERLPEFMVPSSLTLLERFPLTVQGKLDRRALPQPDLTSERGTGYLAPNTPTQTDVAAIWQDVLGIEQVSASDSFFQLGGHSLLAARVAKQVRERLSVDVPVRALFEDPTLEAYSARLDALREGGEGEQQTASVPVADSDPLAPAVETVAAAPPSASASDRFPLSFQQQQLLFLDHLSPGSPTYNAALAIRVRGHLDREALRRSLAMVIERHEALRTVLVWGEHAPEQVVLDRWTVELPIVDLTQLPGDDLDGELQRVMRDQARRPFDLERDLMVRATLFELDSADHVILFQPHHVALDGWSVDLFFRELSEIYDAYAGGRAPSLTELELQYRDFALRQRERVTGRLLDEETAYWVVQLAGAPTTSPLPGDHPRASQQTFDGATHELTLEGDAAQAVRSACHEAQVTPYMFLLGVFATLLYRRTGRDDILFGGPFANRGEPEFEHVIGFFANTLVVRVRLGGNPTFADLLDRVRGTVLDAYDHQDLSFEQVVEAVRPEREPGANPVFQINFRVRVGEPPRLELTGAETSPVGVEVGLARFDLALELHLRDGDLRAEFNYDTHLFERETIEGLAADFDVLLREVLADRHARLLGLHAGDEGAPGDQPRGPEIRGFREIGAGATRRRANR
jgi:amino acid adenylation domain-containing protein